MKTKIDTGAVAPSRPSNAPADLSKGARSLLAAAVEVLEPVDRCLLAFGLLAELGQSSRAVAAELLGGRPTPATAPPPSDAEMRELITASTAIATLVANGLELGAVPAVPLLRVAGAILDALRTRGWELPAPRVQCIAVRYPTGDRCIRREGHAPATEHQDEGGATWTDAETQALERRMSTPAAPDELEPSGGPCPLCRAVVNGATHDGKFLPAVGPRHAPRCTYWRGHFLTSDASARVNRLLRKWTPGERATAVVPLWYAAHDLDVPMSSLGTVVDVNDAGVLFIRWDGFDVVAATSPDSVDPHVEEPTK